MAINQFAKISPIINREGYLYNLNSEGLVVDENDVSNIRLKTNEIGIIYKEDALATMSNGKLIRIGGVSAYDETTIDELLDNNTNRELDGKLIVYKEGDQYYLLVVQGSELVLPEYHSIKSFSECVANIDDISNISDNYMKIFPIKLHRICFRLENDVALKSYLANKEYKFLVFRIEFNGVDNDSYSVTIDSFIIAEIKYHTVNVDDDHWYPVIYVEDYIRDAFDLTGWFSLKAILIDEDDNETDITSTVRGFKDTLNSMYIGFEYSLDTNSFYTR